MIRRYLVQKVTFGFLLIFILIGYQEYANPVPNSTCVPTAFAKNWLQTQEQLGGHTIERHVGRTNQQLVDRLLKDSRISSVSTYPDLQTATIHIQAALKLNANNLNRWENQAAIGEKRVVDYTANKVVGRVAIRPPSLENIANSKEIRIIILKKAPRNCLVLTSYPSR